MKLKEYKKNKKKVNSVVECLKRYKHFKRTDTSKCRLDCGVSKMCDKIYPKVKKISIRQTSLMLDDAIVIFEPIDK